MAIVSWVHIPEPSYALTMRTKFHAENNTEIWGMNPQLILVHYNQGLDQSWSLHPAPPSLLRLRYGRDIRPLTEHISLPLTLLQFLAFYTTTTGRSTKFLWNLTIAATCRRVIVSSWVQSSQKELFLCCQQVVPTSLKLPSKMGKQSITGLSKP